MAKLGLGTSAVRQATSCAMEPSPSIIEIFRPRSVCELLLQSAYTLIKTCRMSISANGGAIDHTVFIYSVNEVMDQIIQSNVTSLFLNQISQTFYQSNGLPMYQNHFLRSFVRSCWKKDTDCFRELGFLSKCAKFEFSHYMYTLKPLV